MTTPRCIVFLAIVLALGPVRAGESKGELANLTLREKVGQLFLIGFPQSRVDKSLSSFIETQKPGGFILFRRNLKDSNHIRKFTAELTKLSQVSGLDPFLAVDQEGGPVTRVPVFPSLPSALSVGLTGREDLARDLGEESGQLLRWSGFNLNLAPVLDLSDPKTESFIGARSFGADPILSGKLGFAYAEGLKKAGIIPTGKHFLGLGGTKIDLHIEAAKAIHDPQAFRERDLKPFATYSKLGPLSALMISQMSYPFLDPSGLPAPFSKAILKDLLRRELAYQGLVITDDLQMKGSAVTFPARDAALESLKAGADIVMITWSVKDQTEAMRRVEEAVENKEWDEAELNERVQRVLAVKKLLKETIPTIPLAIARGPAGTPATKKLEKIDLELLDSKLESYKTADMAKSDKPLNKVCVLSTDKEFLASFRKAYPVKIRPLMLTSRSADPAFRNSLKSCPLIVFTVNGRKTAKVLQLFHADLREKTVLVNFGPAALMPEESSWALRLELGHPHLHSGHRIAEIVRYMSAPRKMASTNQK